MSATAKVLAFSNLEDETSVAPIEVAPSCSHIFIRVQHPLGGSRLISILLGPKGGIDISRGVKQPD